MSLLCQGDNCQKREKIRAVGVILDLCIHDIDLVRWLTQSEIVEHQVMVAGPDGGHEDLAFLQLRTASDVVASIRGD